MFNPVAFWLPPEERVVGANGQPKRARAAKDEDQPGEQNALTGFHELGVRERATTRNQSVVAASSEETSLDHISLLLPQYPLHNFKWSLINGYNSSLAKLQRQIVLLLPP